MNNENLAALIQTRRDLSCACDSDGAFPGSRAWTRAQAAEKALAAFDAAHPEVLAAIQADHAAKMAGRYQD